MSTGFYSHPSCVLHDMGAGHPESPSRLRIIDKLIHRIDWQEKLRFIEAPALDPVNLYKTHPRHHVDAILEMSPGEGRVALDGDTMLCPHSLTAALHAAGAGLQATDDVISGKTGNAFCSVRPPGHHAESIISMGFCIFNNIALAAERALSQGLQRVAILDFDVHHGNGTVEIFQDRPEVLVCSSFQYPFYPGRYDNIDRPNICLTPLAAGTDSSRFRASIEKHWQKAVSDHQPEMIFISAGFDAHRDDPLGGLLLTDEDYFWITQFICDLADKYAAGKIVSMLEGGYDLNALARSVQCHLQGLTGQTSPPP